MRAKQLANTHRRQKKWEEAERVLRWVYDILKGDEPDVDQAILAVARPVRPLLSCIFVEVRGSSNRASTTEKHPAFAANSKEL
jgi:hypothetical protein